MKGMKDSVQVSTPNLSNHDLTHTINTSFDFYQFRPVFCEEMYPKDHMKVNVRDYFRASPMAGAAYGSCYKKYSAFFVPYRIIWDKWSDYLTGGSSGKLEFDFPSVTLKDLLEVATRMYANISQATAASPADIRHSSAVYRHMLDYWSDLGVPTDIMWFSDDIDEFRTDVENFEWPVLKFFAARRIWFDWYRDQNLIGDDVENTYCPKNITGARYPEYSAGYYEQFRGNGDTGFLSPLPVPLEKDYFTTAMVEPQRGGAAFVPVSLPSVDVNPGFVYQPSSSATNLLATNSDGDVGYRENNSSSYPLLSSANNIIGMFDYNLVRVAKGVQKFLEKNNIAGGADLQQLLAHWGTAPNPAVFQKSTYIGSFTDFLNLEELVSTQDTSANTSGGTPLSTSYKGEITTKLNMTGNGQFEYTANEHGFFVIVMICRPENTYVGALRRSDRHGCLGNGRFDFFTSELEKTGFQPIYAWELTSAMFLRENQAVPLDYAHGFAPRYAETKVTFNRFTGQLAAGLDNNLRIARDWRDLDRVNELFINTDFTMVYGYPSNLRYDSWFRTEDPLYDHFDGWISFGVDLVSERHSFAAPLIEDSKGNDITLPYAGVRM